MPPIFGSALTTVLLSLCRQMVMAVFAFIYHQSFIIPETLSVEMILEQACFPPCVFLPQHVHWSSLELEL